MNVKELHVIEKKNKSDSVKKGTKAKNGWRCINKMAGNTIGGACAGISLIGPFGEPVIGILFGAGLGLIATVASEILTILQGGHLKSKIKGGVRDG